MMAGSLAFIGFVYWGPVVMDISMGKEITKQQLRANFQLFRELEEENNKLKKNEDKLSATPYRFTDLDAKLCLDLSKEQLRTTFKCFRELERENNELKDKNDDLRHQNNKLLAHSELNAEICLDVSKESIRTKFKCFRELERENNELKDENDDLRSQMAARTSLRFERYRERTEICLQGCEYGSFYCQIACLYALDLESAVL